MIKKLSANISSWRTALLWGESSSHRGKKSGATDKDGSPVTDAPPSTRRDFFSASQLQNMLQAGRGGNRQRSRGMLEAKVDTPAPLPPTVTQLRASQTSAASPRLKSISVFCGSRAGSSEIFMDAARRVGEALAAHQITTVYGGAWVGTMGALADSALGHGGRVIGVVTQSIKQEGLAHRALTRLVVTSNMSDRLAVMAAEGDGCIVLPGGLGTLHEFFELYTSSFLGDYKKPIGLLNVKNFYDPLFTLIDCLTEQGFVSVAHRETLIVSDDIESLLDAMQKFEYSAKNKLSEHEGKLACCDTP